MTGEAGDTGSAGDSGETGGTSASGGATGGRAQGGNRTGGSGGAANGGRAQGGSGTGGSQKGGAANGGSINGGSANGGSVNGGSANGGSVNGGTASGGTSGPSTGGSTSVGGKNTGGLAATCTDSDASDYRTRGTAKGTNGSFEDECDAGELIEYVCEMQSVGPNCLQTNGADAAPGFRPAGGQSGIAPPIDCFVQTGRVIESQVDCGGRCRDGTCFYWCPTTNDEVEYLQVQGGDVLVENTTSHFRYQCEVTFERNGYNCADPDLEGHTAGVYSLGNCSTTQVVFGTDTAEEPGIQKCTYTCALVD